MISTFLSYNLVTRDMKASLDRVASDPNVSRDAKYYEENIGNVTSVKEFMDDYRLYSYAMKAHGLEDMTYAKAFMEKVLESDLSDENSYANKLSDDRYRNFAASFNFTPDTADVQSDAQEEDTIGLYKQSLADEATSVADETAYYKDTITRISSVDDLLGNARLKNYVLDAFDIQKDYYSNDYLRSILTSDLSDTESVANKTGKSNFKAMAAAFSFDASGNMTGSSVQTEEQQHTVVQAYTFNVPSYTIPAAAEMNKEYFEEQIKNITSVDELTSDSRLFGIVKTALGLDQFTLKSTFANIVTSDLSDPNNYAQTFGGAKYVQIAQMFNFQTDGSVASGETAQTDDNIKAIMNKYMTAYDDEDQATLADLTDYYSTNMKRLESADELISNKKIHDMVLKAYGIGEDEISDSELRKILTSDLSDPASFANKAKDDRFVKLARDFNFDSEGDATAPLLAQSEASITSTAKDYIVAKTKFADAEEKDQIKKEAEAEATYYQENITKITSAKELLSDSRLVDFLLEANGIDPESVSSDDMEKMFASDLDDPKSFVNQQSNERFAEIVASFNFDQNGQLTRETLGTIQQRGAVKETQDLYLHQSLEEEQGDDNAGVRLALYFERMAPTVTSAYDILGDSALLEVFRTAYNLPSEISSMDIDKQAALVKKTMNLEDLDDPDELRKFVQRFIAMYDLQNDDGSSNAAVSILSGSGGSISADTLLSLAQLNTGG
ncbi:DUF1217 domain-containing protein [Rhizobium sp. PAMB 3174]